MLIQGNLTAYVDIDADDQQTLNILECDIISLIQKLLTSMSPAEIEGLEEITYIGSPMCETPDAASTSATEDTNGSGSSAGLAVGVAVGGMCMVLIGLLVVRQRMSRRREDGTSVDGSGLVKENSRALSVTVDQNESQQTFGITPTGRNPDGTLLGISASPDYSSEWSGTDDKFRDIETARERADLETSEVTNSFGTKAPSMSPDPPSMDGGDSLHFKPIVHEEQHLTHECSGAR
jgi:hypothetical protein